ncbi:MAG: class I SAM-dependent methyltransferase [Candidatus Brocadia sp.]|nr:class I SAM-dependent methyltransferase [Candidatus Brocadia sp.]
MEHHNPLGKSDYLSIQHRERYAFAISCLTPGQQLLDIACGDGYGTVMLSRYGCNTIGADCDEQTVSGAQIKYPQGSFVRADVLNIPFEDNSFDAVVSFETIEHVNDGNRFLSEVHRVLRPSGIFICSTPNIRYTSHPPYHIKEYSPEEFYELVQHWFPQAEHHGQYFKSVDRLSDLYRRHIHAHLTTLLDKTNVRKTLKYLLRPDMKEHRENPVYYGKEDLMIGHTLEEKFNSYYQVRPFVSARRLRIMIVVAKKEEA